MIDIKTLLVVSVLSIYSHTVKADHFNAFNLINACKQDTSFDSACYSYLAAYRDILAGVLFAENEQERMKLFCLLDIPTQDIAEHLQKSEYPYRTQTVPTYLVKSFCD